MQVLDFDDAFDQLVAVLQTTNPPNAFSLGSSASHGCDLYLPNIVPHIAQQRGYPAFYSMQLAEFEKAQFYVPFYDAAAELCRIGVLRLGHFASMGQRSDLSADCYSVTSYGREWIASHPEPITRDPGRLMTVLASYRARFGAGFIQRADEAVRCYRSSNYLASCVMCGAAVESVLLATAIAKIGEEERVLREYTKGGGRRKVMDMVVGKLPVSIRNQFESYAGLMIYWRDEAGHGRPTMISEPEANLSLLQTVRFAQMVNESWGALTGQ